MMYWCKWIGSIFLWTLSFDVQPVASQGSQFPVILGRPFLATTNAIIHCKGGLMTLSFGNTTVNLNIFNVIKEVWIMKIFAR